MCSLTVSKYGKKLLKGECVSVFFHQVNFCKQKEQLNSNTNNVVKRCNKYERDIFRSSFGNSLRSDGPLIKNGERKRCDICEMSVETTDYEKHVISDNHSLKWTRGLKNSKSVNFVTNSLEKNFMKLY